MKSSKNDSSAARAGRSVRLDRLLQERGEYATRARAADAIRRGTVRVSGAVVSKPGTPVDPSAAIEIDDPAASYVSRGALKLVHALDAFGLDPRGQVCLDIGASTGGFTQVLLERGAERVFAIDVGHGQLDAALRDDPRIVVREGVNARALSAEHVSERPAAIVADVSFVSLRLALPPALSLAADGAWAVALFKPQFELGRDALGKAGIVRDQEAAARAAQEFAAWICKEAGWEVLGIEVSPLPGGDGNREYLIGLRRS